MGVAGFRVFAVFLGLILSIVSYNYLQRTSSTFALEKLIRCSAEAVFHCLQDPVYLNDLCYTVKSVEIESEWFTETVRQRRYSYVEQMQHIGAQNISALSAADFSQLTLSLQTAFMYGVIQVDVSYSLSQVSAGFNDSLSQVSAGFNDSLSQVSAGFNDSSKDLSRSEDGGESAAEHLVRGEEILEGAEERLMGGGQTFVRLKGTLSVPWVLLQFVNRTTVESYVRLLDNIETVIRLTQESGVCL